MTHAEHTPSQERLYKATATARMLMKQSVIISKLVGFRIECIRLLILADSVLESE